MTLKQFYYDGRGYLVPVPTPPEVLAAARVERAARTAQEAGAVDPVRAASAPEGRWARIRAALAGWLAVSPEDRMRADYERHAADLGGQKRRARRLRDSLARAALAVR